MPWNKEIKANYENFKKELLLAGGEERLKREGERGKLTARERMEKLFDDGKFTEINMLAKSRIDVQELQKKHYLGDGVIAGYGKVNGTIVYAVSQDCTVSGGAGGETHVKKMCEALELAIKTKSPFICLCDSGGARIEEGIVSLAAYSKLFYLNTQASGYIPQIAAIMGNCAGGSSYSPALCDFVFMVEKTSQFFITGPKVIKTLTGESVSMDELGGTRVHSQNSGVANFVCENDDECIRQVRKLIEYVSDSNKQYISENKEVKSISRTKIEDIVPESNRLSYDIRDVIECIVDKNTFWEVSKEFAKNMIIGFARMDGNTIGIVANQPCVMGGAIDCDAADKCSRFVRFCDCYDIPLVVMVDVPGFYPGRLEERKGILRHGSKMLYAFSEATVPKVTVIMRKAYGGAYCAMNSKEMGADVVFAWPICEIAVMGADGAVDVMFHKQIMQAEDSSKYRQEQIEIYKEKYLNPYYAAAHGMVDEVIMPEETRDKIRLALESLKNKSVLTYNKKHGNIPL